jgi:hypothetical protein
MDLNQILPFLLNALKELRDSYVEGLSNGADVEQRNVPPPSLQRANVRSMQARTVCELLLRPTLLLTKLANSHPDLF